MVSTAHNRTHQLGIIPLNIRRTTYYENCRRVALQLPTRAFQLGAQQVRHIERNNSEMHQELRDMPFRNVRRACLR